MPLPMSMSSHRRWNNSGELDVFEATRYFSGFVDDVAMVAADHKIKADAVAKPNVGHSSSVLPNPRVARRSLDVPMTRANVAPNAVVARADRNQAANKEKSPRTPSSPGGKIVSFLNSLFNQSASGDGGRKKKVKKTAATRSMKDPDQVIPRGWQRRRRSSISHVPTLAESKSLPGANPAAPSFSSSSSVSRIPPPGTMNDAPRNDTGNLSGNGQAAISVSIGNRAREEFVRWKASCVEKEVKNSRNMVAADPPEDEFDDGNESDMSSDLFELPVYDSIRTDSIRRSSMSTDSSGSSFMKLHV